MESLINSKDLVVDSVEDYRHLKSGNRFIEDMNESIGDHIIELDIECREAMFCVIRNTINALLEDFNYLSRFS